MHRTCRRIISIIFKELFISMDHASKPASFSLNSNTASAWNVLGNPPVSNQAYFFSRSCSGFWSLIQPPSSSPSLTLQMSPIKHSSVQLRKADNIQLWRISAIPRECWFSRCKRCKTLPSLSFQKHQFSCTRKQPISFYEQKNFVSLCANHLFKKSLKVT